MELRDSQRVWEFFHAQLGLHGSADFRGVCHVPNEYRGCPMSMEHVAVAIGYNGFVGKTCCMHVVIKRPELLSRRIIREAFTYAFDICNCEAVLGLVDSENHEAMSLDLRLGFRVIARVPNGGSDGDLVILQMTRDKCRWLRKPH